MKARLDLDLLASFVALAEHGSVTAAARRVFRTQSAVSLQIGRLEQQIGRKLVARQGRRVALTRDGETFLGHAREMLALNERVLGAMAARALGGKLRFGLTQDFADTVLARVLKQFARAHPDVELEVTVGRSFALADAVRRGQLDLALAVNLPNGDGALLRRDPMLWIAGAGFDAAPFRRAGAAPLPLALLDAPCSFRDAALAALDRKKRAWRIVLTSPSLSGIRAAVGAGLALTVRTSAFVGDGLRRADAALRLPALPRVGFALYAAETAPPPAAARLKTLLIESLGTPRR